MISSRKTLPSSAVLQTCSRTLKPSLVLAWCWGHISIQCSVKFCNTSDLTIWHFSCRDLIWTYNFPRRSFTAMFSSFIWRWKRLSCETPIVWYWRNQYTTYMLGLLNIFEYQFPLLVNKYSWKVPINLIDKYFNHKSYQLVNFTSKVVR